MRAYLQSTRKLDATGTQHKRLGSSDPPEPQVAPAAPRANGTALAKPMIDEPKKMTCTEAGEMILLLSATFRVPAPPLVWSERQRNGHYRNGSIWIGPNCWRGPEASLIHEFTHHLAARLRRGPDAGWYRGGLYHHGPTFVALLKGVAAAWYGDPTKYRWDTEYRSMRRIGDNLANAAGSREER